MFSTQPFCKKSLLRWRIAVNLLPCFCAAKVEYSRAPGGLPNRISEGGSSQNTTLSHALQRRNNSGDGFIHRQKTKHELPVVPQSSRHYHHEMIYSAAVKHETYFSAASMDAPTGRASAESISGKWNFRFSFDNENSDEVILFCRYF